MPVNHSTDVRNAMMDAYDDRVNAGSTDPNADFVFIDSTGPLDVAEIALQDPAFVAANASQVAIAGTPLSVFAAAGGTIDTYEIRNKDNTTCADGTVTPTGGGGDIEIDNATVNSGQKVQLDSYSETAPP